MSEEDEFLASLEQQNSDEVRLVYADWLESHGQTAKAEYLRADCRRRADHLRLAALEPTLDARWIAAAAGPEEGITLVRVRCYSDDEGEMCCLRDADIWPALRESLRDRDRGSLVALALGLRASDESMFGEGGFVRQAQREGWEPEDIARAQRFTGSSRYPMLTFIDPTRSTSRAPEIEVIEGINGVMSMGFRFCEPSPITHIYERSFDGCLFDVYE